MSAPSSVRGFRLSLRAIGLALAIGVVGYWAAAGAHRGWSRDSLAVKKTDEITGIEYVEYQDKFVPGIDMLAIGVGLGLGLAGLSFLFGKSKSTS